MLGRRIWVRGVNKWTEMESAYGTVEVHHAN